MHPWAVVEVRGVAREERVGHRRPGSWLAPCVRACVVCVCVMHATARLWFSGLHLVCVSVVGSADEEVLPTLWIHHMVVNGGERACRPGAGAWHSTHEAHLVMRV